MAGGLPAYEKTTSSARYCFFVRYAARRDGMPLLPGAKVDAGFREHDPRGRTDRFVGEPWRVQAPLLINTGGPDTCKPGCCSVPG